MAVRKWRRRGKNGTWYVRLWVPVREHGEIVRRRREHSTGCTRKSDAEKVADNLEADYHEAARTNREADGSDTTFADAVTLYIQNNPNRREAYFLTPLVKELGNLTLDQLTQTEVQRVAHELYGHCKPNTQSRQVYDPINAVRNYAVEAGLCRPMRYKKPKGWNKPKRVKSPPDEWYLAVMPYLSVKLRALVVLLSTHGLRASEALQRTPADIDTKSQPWVLHLGERDKAGDRVQIPLAEHVIEAIEAIPNWREEKWLFGTTSVSNVNRDIKKACRKAGVPYFSTHPLGRHKAARNFIRARGSLKGLQEAYRWKDPRMPMQHYGHEEESEIQQRVHEVGRAFWDTFR
jgi:integrase